MRLAIHPLLTSRCFPVVPRQGGTSPRPSKMLKRLIRPSGWKETKCSMEYGECHGSQEDGCPPLPPPAENNEGDRVLGHNQDEGSMGPIEISRDLLYILGVTFIS